MSRMMWIIVLVGAGVVAAVAIGLIGNHGRDSSNSTASAQSSFCSDVSTLESSVSSLLALDPTSASESDYKDALSQVDNDWDAVKSSASNLKGDTKSQLQDAWDTFQTSVSNVPSGSSVSQSLNDIGSAANTLVSDSKSALSGPNCS
jgi:hypothetical protein